jgi:hypothetical protein
LAADHEAFIEWFVEYWLACGVGLVAEPAASEEAPLER